MKRRIVIFCFLGLWLASRVFALEAASVSAKAQADIEAGLSRLVSPESFIVQVNAVVKTTTERKVVEGESVVQNAVAESELPAALPGFEAPPKFPKPVSPPQTRQVFRTIEKESLQSLSVQVLLDQALSQEVVSDAKGLVRRYLSANYADRASAQFQVIRMRQEQKKEDPLQGLFRILPWAAAFCFGALALFLALRKPRQAASMEPLAAPTAQTMACSAAGPDASALSEAMDGFFRDPEAFRSFYEKLKDEERSRIRATFSGPGFDQFLSAIGLPVPVGSSAAGPMNALELSANLRGFHELVRVRRWQSERFFGYLDAMSDEQIAAFLKRERPLSAAVALRYLDPKRTAAVLERFSDEERAGVVSHSAQATRLSLGEAASIEKALRLGAAQLSSSARGDEVGFWREVLSRCEDESLLRELKEQQPHLYPKLAQFAFRLEKIPELPSAIVQKILDEVENDELAMALLTCPEPVAKAVLAELSSARVPLVSAQIEAYRNLPNERLSPARRSLTRKFREGMA